MLFKKKRWPEEGELVLCTVTKVLPHGVFVNLDEFDTSGLIHISEISPGRIRNIRDFVKEGKVVVCKVLGVNQEKGHIDISLRRVSDNQRKNKVNQIKQEQKAEKILEIVAEKLGMQFPQLYGQISDKILSKYENINACFEDVVMSKFSLKELGIDAKIASELEEAIITRIKPPELTISGSLKITSYAPDGVEKIKKTFSDSMAKEPVSVYYEGGGRYTVKITSSDYKHAEKSLKSFLDFLTNDADKYGTVEFTRND